MTRLPSPPSRPRRSRVGWIWAGGGEVPLGEEDEVYRLTLSVHGRERNVTVSIPEHIYTIADQATDGFAGEMRICVVQVGALAASRPAEILVAL